MNDREQGGDQMRALWDDPSLLATAADEFVRWASPVMSEMRTVVTDVQVGGQPMRAGERIVIWGGSCNRDEAVFDAPDVFDIRRSPNPHVGFSFGEHFCLGAHLARLILRVEFEEMIAAFADIEQTGEASSGRLRLVAPPLSALDLFDPRLLKPGPARCSANPARQRCNRPCSRLRRPCCHRHTPQGRSG